MVQVKYGSLSKKSTGGSDIVYKSEPLLLKGTRDRDIRT